MTDFTSIGSAFVNFYTNLFSTVTLVFDSEFQGLIIPCVTTAHNESLIVIPKPPEVFHALLSMANNKSPGPDEMNSIFYKSYWNIVGLDIISTVQGFFSNPSLNRVANQTFITLILKIPGANRVD